MAEISSDLEITRIDPRDPEAAALINAMTAEIRVIYDFKVDGHGHFKPEDVLVPGSGFFVGRIADKAVSSGAFRPLEDGVAEIKRMFVLPEYRGRGYSKEMLLLLEEEARAYGYTTVRLETRPLQHAAIALYEKLGYKRIPGYGIYAGQEAACLCYEKSLSEGGE
jgi:putative acetyltransferase